MRFHLYEVPNRQISSIPLEVRMMATLGRSYGMGTEVRMAYRRQVTFSFGRREVLVTEQIPFVRIH